MAAVVTISVSLVAAPASAASGTVERDRALRARVVELLPPGYRDRLAYRAGDGELRALVERAIDPGDYVCESTPLFDWLNASVEGWTREDAENVLLLITLNVAFLDQLLFPEPAGERYFGRDGEYTGTLQRTFRDLRRFWDIDGSDIELVPAHGATLRDPVRVARVLKLALGLSDSAADEAARNLSMIVNQPKYDFGEHPIFTFNAYAFTTQGAEIPGVGVPSDKIAMGDGFLEAFRRIGLDDVAPGAVLGHEYGHHIQFDRGIYQAPAAPEESRRLELMADSFGAYHASRRGAGHRRLLATFHNMGDCLFDNVAHHGTPNQRRHAAQWARDLAARPGKVPPTPSFARLFDRALPGIVAPDAA
jgi:hypothetical protein